MVKMRVVDQLHVSSVGPNTMAKGTEFEVSAATAKDLEKRGVATRVGGDDGEEEAQPAAQAEKAAPEPLNKMAAAPANKDTRRKTK